MLLEEAQRLSPHKIAVWGNYTMKDVIWRQGDECPLIWLVRDYVRLNFISQKRRTSNDWEPLEEKDGLDLVKRLAIMDALREQLP